MQDDTFNVKIPWMKEVCERIARDARRSYHCHLRIEYVTSEVADILAKTGCRSVTFAVESANPVYRREYLRRDMSNEKIIEGSQRLREKGVMYRIENMLGLPFSSYFDDMDTMEFNATLKPTVGWSSLYQPYPGTELAELARDNGWWEGNEDTIDSQFFGTTTIKLNRREERIRMQRLFSVFVGLPWLLWASGIILRLPLTGFYTWIYRVWKRIGYKRLYG
jgi:radical SAM superfamily enzyme YgiQ (UPF0313 family)